MGFDNVVLLVVNGVAVDRGEIMFCMEVEEAVAPDRGVE